MKFAFSHRWRIALAAAGVAAFVFASVLSGAYAVMVRMERTAARELLDAPLNEVLTSLKSGEPLDEEVGGQERVTVVVFSADGRQLFRSGFAKVGRWSGSGELTFAGRDLLYQSVTYGTETVVAASDWTEPKRRLGEVRTVFLLLLTPSVAFVGLAAFVSAGLMYRPLRALTGAAKRMAAEGRIGQLQDPLDPEFTPLVQELNALLARISSEVERQDRLVSDVAHDLRTPLTVIRGRLETALLKGREADYPAAMRTAVREAERLSAMADAILRGDALQSEVEPIELSTSVIAAVERWTPIFRQRGAELTSFQSECWARLAFEEWESILDNLLDNAFKYGGDSCVVTLTPGSTVCLEVVDNGPGIPEADRERVFERFVRLDASRTSAGYGLGLSLCASTVRQRNGAIRIGPKPGTHVIVTLPALPKPT